MVFSKIDDSSVDSITSAINFFDIPPTNVSISKASVNQYLTLNPLNSKPYYFKVHATTNYIDLSKCYLLTEMKIQKQDVNGNFINIVDADDVSTIQMPGSTFIKNIKITINERETFEANNLYMYKAYFDSEFSFPLAAKNSYLGCTGYYSDVTGTEHVHGHASRKPLFGRSKTAQFLSRIDCDLFNQELYLINNIELGIEITPNDDDFLIYAPGAADTNVYRVEITSCRMFVKTVELMDGLALDVARKLENLPARYALRKSQMKALFITEGRYELNANLFTEQVPRRVIFGMVENAAYVGTKSKNPFNFKHFNVREVSLMANGNCYPSTPFNLDFENGKYMRAYHEFMENLGYANSIETNGINCAQYKDGWTVFCFNLTCSLEDEQCFDLIKNGTTSIHLKFSSPVPAGGISLIALGEVDSILTLDKFRTVTTDTTV